MPYKLDGKIMCQDCFSKVLKEKGIEDKDEYFLNTEEFCSQYGDQNRMRCEDCGIELILGKDYLCDE
ncbi:hypothetical protein ACFL9U_17305 [Thermodesulfobacteriota bacterium]